MFPLGSVLFPTAVLPLQVFEPRYRKLVADVIAADNRFGVTLITRGSDVGGNDERTDVGTIGEIVRIGESEDGRILLVIVGRERVSVVDWLDDDPYPRASVEPFPGGGEADVAAAVDSAAAAYRRLIALAVEMGAIGQSLDLDLPDDPLEASWLLCGAAPLGPFDQQRLLSTANTDDRMALLERMLGEQLQDLRSVLDNGGDAQ
jgi:hypothetical protein